MLGLAMLVWVILFIENYFTANTEGNVLSQYQIRKPECILTSISTSSMAGGTESNMYTHRSDSEDISVFERQSSKRNVG